MARYAPPPLHIELLNPAGHIVARRQLDHFEKIVKFDLFPDYDQIAKWRVCRFDGIIIETHKIDFPVIAARTSHLTIFLGPWSDTFQALLPEQLALEFRAL